MAARYGQVGADAVGQYSLVQDFFRHIEGKIHSAMGGVQPNAPFMGFFGLWYQLTVGIQHATGVTSEVVGDDVTFVQDGQQFSDDVGVVALQRVADVHHQRYPGFHSSPLGKLGHLDTHDLQRRGHHPGLHTSDDTVAVLDGLYGLV